METSGEIEYSSSDRIFKWWTIITLGANIAIAALILLFLTVGPGPLKETGTVTDVFVLFYHMVKEARGIVGIVYLFIFGSNAFLLGRILYQRCSKPDQLGEKVALYAVMSNVGIKLWTILIILIDIAAVIFPLLTLYLRRPDTSYAAMSAEVYASAAAFSTEDQMLRFWVFLWTVIFASNTTLLIRGLFHRCSDGRPELNEQNAWKKLRTMGLLYLVFGAAFALSALVVEFSDYDYHVPHACQCLECDHDIRMDPDGRAYCMKYPPRDIKYAGVSPFMIKGTETAGNICGAAGFALSVLVGVSGLLWLLGRWLPDRSGPCYRLMYPAALPIALALIVVALCLKSAY